ncbi:MULTISPECIES: Glu/Leu/Phe/Val dehydrogenase dimerization domain-containing protein [unclassified Oleiphilus]|uniref:Leu/Phe/Val dehydrogenase n=1 Tax=unclassified Oleiphilus TaxID=2631174 RepID=UPI0007C3C1E4|nr:MULTISPECIES: Glu/Leu/Phe/Val dehydrogenase dimerization domain-containing protein [unclassified Oleiphilus]KZY51354.1 amino acid dehydrogenase [Oleiphilus sp. HI0050]KZZ33582.1 amino acid dehydrogenase [Oleiphilus sp. HI0117]KZZ38342.1 amino acid dehydrogenase [Oleiphilus sp. HI0086]KZZ61435.1 amino acid dehydrogenase [Oleiphilus sp. HI0123]
MFELLDQHQVNELHVRYDVSSGLKAFIAIHNTVLGPALGGCRFIKYPSESHALQDALNLAKGMSYKAALAELPQGGGKSVIMVPDRHFDRRSLFSEFGRFVESLNGRYITAIDSGTSAREMDIIQTVTSHVTSTSDAGNPSSYTAAGVFEGIKASVNFKLGTESLKGLRIAIQGIGNVGYELGLLLAESGAEIVVADINRERVESALREFASHAVSPEQIVQEPCVVFAPCGLSNVINESSLERLSCRIIAGSANVQLAKPELGQRLHEKGILYAPDYVINSGGLIYASLTHSESLRSDFELVSRNEVLQARIHEKILQIGRTLEEVYQGSSSKGRATSVVADQLAEEKLTRLQDFAA